jgi:hypothetical protein
MTDYLESPDRIWTDYPYFWILAITSKASGLKLE